MAKFRMPQYWPDAADTETTKWGIAWQVVGCSEGVSQGPDCVPVVTLQGETSFQAVDQHLIVDFHGLTLLGLHTSTLPNKTETYFWNKLGAQIFMLNALHE